MKLVTIHSQAKHSRGKNCEKEKSNLNVNTINFHRKIYLFFDVVVVVVVGLINQN
jgi:hypothetical protein